MLRIPDINDDDDTLTAALAYADTGWYILPVKTGSKHPGSIVGKAWPALSSRDPKTITAWFAGASHGIALHCGRSGAVVIDVDHYPNIPDEILAAVETTNCPHQSSRPDQPGRGHYLFANTTGRRIGNGLGRLATTPKWGEIRGANGVIIAAPTPHPDGGHYHWERTGELPALPDYITDALPESTNPEDTATDTQITTFFNSHTENLKPEALTGLINALTAKLAAGHSCHMSTLGILTDAMAEAAAGYYDARTATRKLYQPYLHTVTTGTSTGRILTKTEARTSYAGIVAWAIGQAEHNTDKARQRVTTKYPPPVIDITPPPGGTLEQLEQDFWTARPHHQLIYQAALSRMASPWAVLACCIARTICTIPPAIVLPSVIGGPGSLNWFAAISAKSGGGKGAAMAVAAHLLPLEHLRIRGIGSGEGMIEAYERARKKDDDTPPVISVLFMVDEIDSLGAMGGRSGQTTMSILRQGFSGESLGFSYRGRQSETVAAHTYRMALIASVQPQRAGVLFDDAAGGTPQRFMWFPGRDKRITCSPPEWPTTPKGVDRVIPTLSARDMSHAVGAVTIPPEAIHAIREHRALSMSGESDDLDGHVLFTREKCAYALAVIDGRTDINSDDWRLSGIAADVSAWCRGKAKQGYLRGVEAAARERGHQRGIERDQTEVSSQVAFSQHINRIVDVILRKLKDDGPMTTGALNRAITSRDRPRLGAALSAARDHELIKEVDGQWTTT